VRFKVGLPVKVILLPSRGISAVAVPELIVTSSCGKGAREVQWAEVDQLFVVPSQLWAAAGVVVILEFPLQLPESPLIADKSTAFVAVMSSKSRFELVPHDVTVRVAAVPNVFDRTKRRFVALLPERLRVVIVCVVLAGNEILSVFTSAPVAVSVPKVFPPKIIMFPPPVKVRLL